MTIAGGQYRRARKPGISPAERDLIVAAIARRPWAMQEIADEHRLSFITIDKIRAKAGIGRVAQ